MHIIKTDSQLVLISAENLQNVRLTHSKQNSVKALPNYENTLHTKPALNCSRLTISILIVVNMKVVTRRAVENPLNTRLRPKYNPTTLTPYHIHFSIMLIDLKYPIGQPCSS